MAQYDVYANPSHSAASGIPYVVVIQSDLLETADSRSATSRAAFRR
ncbi:MAG TPA: CcdB family protein [Rubrivivax sp.]|nr:CcdB family protein [Rubrivivax sp.]